MRRDQWLMVGAPIAAGAAVVGIFWAGGHDILSRTWVNGVMLMGVLGAALFAWGRARRVTEERRDQAHARASQLDAQIASMERIEMLTRTNAWRRRLAESTQLLNLSRDLLARAADEAKDAAAQDRLRKFASQMQDQAVQNEKAMRS